MKPLDQSLSTGHCYINNTSCLVRIEVIDSLSTQYGMSATELLQTRNDCSLGGHDCRRMEQTGHLVCH